MKRTFIKAAIALALVVVPIVGAIALNFDQSKTPQKRYFGYQMMHYWRVTWNFNDPGLGVAQKFGALGTNSFIHSIKCHVSTAFTSSTKTLSLGTSTTATEIMGTADITLGSVGFTNDTTATGLGLAATSAGDTVLYSKLTLTGGSNTAGAVTCVIAFAPNNDM